MRCLALACWLLIASSSARADDSIELGLTLSGTGWNDGRQHMHVGYVVDDTWSFQAVHLGERAIDGSPSWMIVAARQWRFLQGAWVEPVARFGVAQIIENPPDGGCRSLYYGELGLDFGFVRLVRSHASSAGVCRPNPGIDLTGLVFQVRF